MGTRVTRRSMLRFGSAATASGVLLPTVLAGASAAETPDQLAVPRPGTGLRPFRVRAPEEMLRRVSRRLHDVHLPVTADGAGWDYGVSADWFGQVLDHWARRFDWRSVEAELRHVPQFLVPIDGRELHFAHLRPERPSAGRPPILLLHGWPTSFYSMLPLARLLVAGGFDVVVPSLPGYGFSDPDEGRPRGLRLSADRLARLMTDVLGYERYVVHGGDFGAVIADWLAVDRPEQLAGSHTHMFGLRHFGAVQGSGQTGVPDATPEELDFVAREAANLARESAYAMLAGTRPESIAYALADSPAGLAAFVLDKWQKWTGPSSAGPFPAAYGVDRLIAEVMVYIVSDSVATSLWTYTGSVEDPPTLAAGQRIDVPFGFSSFPDPLMLRMPRRFGERSRSDIRLWREHSTGGHFPMLECVTELARDIVDFVNLLD